MDLRGHGRSSKPLTPDAYRMETLVADALAVLDAVDAPQAHYGGYSVGARMAFSLAVTAPERLLSITSLGGGYHIEPGSIGRLFFPEYDGALATGGMPALSMAGKRGSGARWTPRPRRPSLPMMPGLYVPTLLKRRPTPRFQRTLWQPSPPRLC